MLRNTQGIVIHRINYGETSLVARIFTRELGMQSYLVRGARKARSKRKQMLFQPLTLVNLAVYHKDKEGLQYIREISLLEPYQNIPLDIGKSSQVIFMAEVLSHAIKRQEAHQELFDFLQQALLLLDRSAEPRPLFHLVFMLQLSRFLGFQPRNNLDRQHPFFNLGEGLYQSVMLHPEHCLDSRLSQFFFQLSNTSLIHSGSLSLGREDRKILVRKIIDYYRHHVADMPELKSLEVLESVFADLR